MTAGTFARRSFRKTFAAICLLASLARGGTVGAESPGDPSRAPEGRQERLIVLSIRIAQAEGNDLKVAKYRSIARQQRARRETQGYFRMR